MKKCGCCKEVKEPSKFHKSSGGLLGLHGHCKACRKQESLRQYGLTLETYDMLLEEQGGVCKICKTDDPRGQSKAGRFYVDHNHTTGDVRGLLCHNCNTGIGLLKDSPALLKEAAKYLETNGWYGND